jgi:hypothetical protein
MTEMVKPEVNADSYLVIPSGMVRLLQPLNVITWPLKVAFWPPYNQWMTSTKHEVK